MAEPDQPRRYKSEIIQVSPADVDEAMGNDQPGEATVSINAMFQDAQPGVAYLVESIARSVARTAPRSFDGDAHLAEQRLAQAKRLQELVAREDKDVAPAAVMALKELVHDFLRLRERAALLASTSASAYSALNSNEHKLIEVRAGLDRIFLDLAAMVPNADPDVLRLLDDRKAAVEDRVRAAESALHGLASGAGEVSLLDPGEIGSLRQQLVESEKRLISLQREMEQREREIEHLRTELGHARETASTAESDRAKAVSTAFLRRKEDPEARRRLEAAEAASAAAERRAQALAEELASTTEERDRLAQEGIAHLEALAQLRNRPATIVMPAIAAAESTARIATLEQQLAEARASSATQLAKLASELETARGEAARATRLGQDLEQQQQEIARLRAEVAGHDELRRACAQAQSTAGALRSEIERMRADGDRLRDDNRDHANTQADASALLDRARAEAAQAQAEAAQARAALERQLAEVENQRATQVADYELRLRRLDDACQRLRAEAQTAQAAIARHRDESVRIAEATAAAAARLATAADEAGIADAGLREVSGRLRTLPLSEAPLPELAEAIDTVAKALVAAAGQAETARQGAIATAREAASNAQRLAALDERARTASARAQEVEERAVIAETALVESRRESRERASHILDVEMELAALRQRLTEAEAAAQAREATLEQDRSSLRQRLEAGGAAATIAAERADRAETALIGARDTAARLLGLLREIGADAGDVTAEVLAALPADALAACSSGDAEELVAGIRGTLTSARARVSSLEAELGRLREQFDSVQRRGQEATESHQTAVAELAAARRDLDAVRGEAASLGSDLVRIRDEAAQRNAELASAHHELATLRADLETVRVEAGRLPELIGTSNTLRLDLDAAYARLASEEARAATAETAARELLDAARDAAAVAAGALDRFGLLPPGDSRRLTRATVRLENAEVSGSALGRDLLARAAGQMAVLADRYQAVDVERLALLEQKRGAEIEIAELRARTAGLDERLAAAERLAAERNQLETQLGEARAEADALRGRLIASERAAAEDARSREAVHAEAQAGIEARAQQAAEALAEANARIAALAADLASASARADEASERITAAEAEAASRLVAAEAAVTEREERLTALANELDRLRAERGEAVGLGARLKALDERLATVLRDNARLASIAEHAAAPQRPDHTEARDAAERRARAAELALADERLRCEALARARERQTRDHQVRIDRAEAELGSERERLSQAETELASCRIELAGVRARLKALSPQVDP